MTRVVLLDDHALIRRGLRDTLADEDFEFAGEAGSWEEFSPMVGSVPMDILLLDINLPGTSGLDILEMLRPHPGAPRVLVVSMYPEDPYALRSLGAGAWGYVNKSSPPSTLVTALRKVARGERYFSEATAQAMSAHTVPSQSLLPHQRLSAREQVLLGQLASGRRLADIARDLGLPDRTVSVYRARLLEKMKLSSNAELAQYATRHHLLPQVQPAG